MKIPSRNFPVAGLTYHIVKHVRAAATVLSLMTILVSAGGLTGQGLRKSESESYINPGVVPSPARSFLFALGDRVQRPGRERVTLTGKYVDRRGTADVRVVWQSPGQFRLDRSDQPGRPMIYREGWNEIGAIGSEQTEALESLFDDSADLFFREMTAGTAHRFLGNRFRFEGSKTPNDAGPWYDVYELFATVRSPADAPMRRKLFFFDSQTGLLSRVEYEKRGAVRIATEWSNWQMVDGQAIPGAVSRKENGVAVLTINVTAAAVAPAAADGMFSGR